MVCMVRLLVTCFWTPPQEVFSLQEPTDRICLATKVVELPNRANPRTYYLSCPKMPHIRIQEVILMQCLCLMCYFCINQHISLLCGTAASSSSFFSNRVTVFFGLHCLYINFWETYLLEGCICNSLVWISSDSQHLSSYSPTNTWMNWR